MDTGIFGFLSEGISYVYFILLTSQQVTFMYACLLREFFDTLVLNLTESGEKLK